PLHYEDVGWSCPADRQLVLEQYLVSDHYGRDLTAEHFFSKFPVGLRTFLREQIIPNSEWVRSAVFNDFVRRGRLDLAILAKQTFGRKGHSNNLILYSSFGEAPLPERSRRLVHLTQLELGPLLGTALAVAGDPGWSNLPPRWRQTL